MEKFVTHTGVGVPLKVSNVDTDQILPAMYLKRISKTGFDDALFERWRQDEDFVLNQPAYSHGSVLVAGPDFGTGSSREHAVWALRDYGFKVILSARFGDIFRSNAGKQGLVAGVVNHSDIELIWKELENHPGTAVSVDLAHRVVSCGGITTHFDIDDYTRWRLMEGLDDIGITLRHEKAIADFEKRRPGFKPTTLPAKRSSFRS
ncbi:3-isopropylmalate dehydratase small subunit [Auritidibacter ignavus]|uniref:3-isopropylmalate dehydratase small subunit n=1 Tax=Auritidibacter ignavus TaxID=678932 RepID=UPI0024475A85|nr:3-isopropylmalate dehydratase small subunit [Auritidibacter ignavus]WGH91051.1 3-isopropylmalate dehydratase small subunit [Auritidibacter ignavus]